MSYEKKMKDLMARLVAMSPEPPPYPEEMQLADRQEKRTLRPVFVFAGAAVLVAALAVPLLLFTGGEDPILVPSSTTSTTLAPTTSATVPEPSTTTVPDTTTTEPTTTTSQPVLTPWAGTVFVTQEAENNFTGNPALVPLPIAVSAPGLTQGSDPTAALAALGELPEGFGNEIPSDVVVSSSELVDGVIRAEMSEAFPEGSESGGALGDFTMLNQLIYSLTMIDPNAGVLFTVDGEPVTEFGSEGLVLTDPVTRDSFIDELNLIFLTEPVVEQDGVYTVAGRSNTFEASLVVNVLDGNGEVVHEQFLTATCGSGCWGEFSTTIDASLIEPGESSIHVFQPSAEDGSVTNGITIPIPVGDVWAYSAEG